MSNFKISVIIPTYNTGYYLKQAVDSIINQTIEFENIELILVDDKSDDEYTINLLEKYDKMYSNSKLIILDEHTGFPGRPRNVGFENSTGDYVIFMDSDDTYSLDAFEVMYDTAIEEDVDFVITNFTKIFKDRTEFHKHPDFEDSDSYRAKSIDENPNFLKLQPSLWSRLFKREFLIKNNIWSVEGVNAQDLEFVVHSLLCAENFIYLSSYSSYNYSVREDENNKSAIRNHNEKLLHGLLGGYLATYKILKEFDKESYFSIFFEKHIKFYMNILGENNVSDNVKINLIRQFAPLLKKQLEITPNFLDNICSPINKPLLNDDYEEVIKNINKAYKARLELEPNKYSEIYYKNENYNTLRFDMENSDAEYIVFTPLKNRVFPCKCSIIDFKTDFDISKLISLSAVNSIDDKEQIFPNKLPTYRFYGDFSKGSFFEITFSFNRISASEFNLFDENIKLSKDNMNLLNENDNLKEKNKNLKEKNKNLKEKNKNLKEKNKNLKSKNKDLNKENRKLNKKVTYYEKLLETKPYKLAKILRNTSEKFKKV